MNIVYAVMKNQNYLWHPNTQMSEWTKFPKIVRGDGMWLIDEMETDCLMVWRACGVTFGVILKEN